MLRTGRQTQANYNNKMPWFSWPGKKKKSVDFNAFLISKAKQQKEEADLEQQRRFYADQQGQKNDDSSGNNSRPSPRDQLVRQRQVSSFFASARPRALQPTSFSLVLTDEDLKGLELQRKLEKLRQQGKEARESRRQELEGINQVLGQCKETLNEQWDRGIEWSDYLEVAIRSMAERAETTDRESTDDGPGSAAEDAGNVAHEKAPEDTAVRGSREADLMKVWHKVDMQDRLRKLLQEQTGDEIMRIYTMESTLKEKFGETEAKVVSQMVRMGVELGEQREYNEERVAIHEKMKARYEKASKDHLDRVYQALREPTGDTEEKLESAADMGYGRGNGEPKKRPSMMAKSYSSRVLAADAEEKRLQRIRKESSAQAAASRVAEEDGGDEETTATSGKAGDGQNLELDINISIKESDAAKNEDLGLSGHDTDSSEKENGLEVRTGNASPRSAAKAASSAARYGTSAPHIGTGSTRNGTRGPPGSAATSRYPSSRSRLTNRTDGRSGGPTNTMQSTADSDVSRSAAGASLRPGVPGGVLPSSDSKRPAVASTPARIVGSTGRPTAATTSRLTRNGAQVTAASNMASRRAVSTASIK